MSEMINWEFKELVTGVPERDPQEAEFFRLQDPSGAFVREIIQNSLDARKNGELCIRVRFAFGNVEKTHVERYINGLVPHLESCGFIPRDFMEQNSLPFLTVEDFGTIGLDGSTGEDGIRPEKGKSNFFDFWWREGISGKKETKAGRWGLGKTTFHIASGIRTFFGYTIRHDDLRRLLMGKTLLKTHTINSTGYQYFGYFIGNENKPISDKAVIYEFERIFLINRGDKHGLSLVIPVPCEGINTESVLKSVLVNYFYPIAKGILEVEIGVNGNTLIINNQNLTDTVVSQDWEGTHFKQVNVHELMQFIFSAVSYSSPIDIKLDPNKLEITEELFGNEFNPLRDSFNAGDLLTFRIHLSITEANESQSALTDFTVHLQKTTHLKEAEEFWFRSGIKISDIKTLGNKPVRAMVVAENMLVANFLGDAETPAHTNWKEDTEGFREKYQNATRILRFIKKSVIQIVTLFDRPPQEVKRDFLKEIFFVQISNEVEEVGNATNKPIIIDKPPTILKFITSQITGGFKVFLNQKNQNISFPLMVKVVVAYDVRRGDPFKQYERFDFDFEVNLLPIRVRGCNILKREKNIIEIKITSRDFEITVTGFDQNRDLVLKVMEVQL